MARYRSILGAPGAKRLLGSSVVARLPIAMMYLAVVLLVLEASGSAALAGLCVGAFGLVEGIGSPLQGRLIDRFGQGRVLGPAAIAYAAALAGLAGASEAGAPDWTLVVLCAVSGAAYPVVASAMRALWPALVAGEAELPTAYALESVLQSATWLLGPLLVAVLVAVASPLAGVLGTALLAAVGTLAFVSSPVSRAWRPAGQVRRGALGALASPGVRTVVAGTFAVGVAGGGFDVGCPAFAAAAGSPALGGVLLGAAAGGAVVGGALYGGWGAARASRDYGVAAALLALATAPAILGGSPWLVGFWLFVAGLALAPMLGCGYRLVDRLAPQGMATEAFAWTSTAFGAGEALGCPLAGSLIDARGATAAFALSVAAAASGALAIVLRRRTLAPSTSDTGPGLRSTTTPQPQEA